MKSVEDSHEVVPPTVVNTPVGFDPAAGAEAPGCCPKDVVAPVEAPSEQHLANAQAHKSALKRWWATFGKAGVFVIAAVVVIALLVFAWFVSNMRVASATSTISAAGSQNYVIATLADNSVQGVYDSNPSGSGSTLEKALNRLFRYDRNGREDEGHYFNSFTGLPELQVGTTTMVIDDKTYIVGDSTTVSLMVNAGSSLANESQPVVAGDNGSVYSHIGPNSRGSATFYLIPKIDNPGSIQVNINLAPYTLVKVEPNGEGETVVGKAQALTGEGSAKILSMLSGHMQLYLSYDGTDYGHRIYPTVDAETGVVTYALPVYSGADMQANTPVEVTFYWIWPFHFDDMVYAGQSTSVFQTQGCEDQSELINWLNTEGGRGSIVNLSDDELADLKEAKTDMSNADRLLWSSGYNRGDQIIGDSVAYFQWTIEATSGGSE